jgi:hypothetical protein
LANEYDSFQGNQKFSAPSQKQLWCKVVKSNGQLKFQEHYGTFSKTSHESDVFHAVFEAAFDVFPDASLTLCILQLRGEEACGYLRIDDCHRGVSRYGTTHTTCYEMMLHDRI